MGSGHYLHLPTGTPYITVDEQPWGRKIDGGLMNDANFGKNTEPDGRLVFAQRDGWSALSFWDRSGDSRPGSVTVFLVHELIDRDQLLARARGQWPEWFARPGFPIKQPELLK